MQAVIIVKEQEKIMNMINSNINREHKMTVLNQLQIKYQNIRLISPVKFYIQKQLQIKHQNIFLKKTSPKFYIQKKLQT